MNSDRSLMLCLNEWHNQRQLQHFHIEHLIDRHGLTGTKVSHSACLDKVALEVP